jgi:hypothetical protein
MMSDLRDIFPYSSDAAAYLCNISERLKFFYLANPKTGCTTVLRTLQLAEFDGAADKLPEYTHDRSTSPLHSPLTISAPLNDVLRSDGDFFKFSYVRNPFTRCLSSYLEKIVDNADERRRLLPTLGIQSIEPISFLTFLLAVREQPDQWRYIHWATQALLVQSDRIKYDYIGRFEQFGQSFPMVLEVVGIPREYGVTGKFIRHETRAIDQLGQFVGSQERSLIQKIYADDFERFCYSKRLEFAAL